MIDRQGLLTQPTGMPAQYVDKDTNEIRTGYPLAPFHSYLHIEAREADGTLIGVREGPTNLCTNQFAAFVQYFILGNTSLNTNPKRLSDGAATAISGANTACLGLVGTGATAAAVTDYKLQTPTGDTISVATTVGSNPTTGTTSGTFTVTFTATAGSARAYAEVGLQITNNSNAYLVCHDVFSVLNVSSSGTLACTYTFTNS
jgi:hypothetical protein